MLTSFFSSVFSAVFDWEADGLQVLGKVSPGNVQIRLPFGSGIGDYATKCIGTSTVIAVLGFLDSIVGAKDSASKFDYPISPNRELVAIGAANLATSVVSGTLPGYGSITRSRLAGATGATTQMASLLTGTFVLLVTYFLLGFLVALPKCILAVIILVVVFSILEEAPHDVKVSWGLQPWARTRCCGARRGRSRCCRACRRQTRLSRLVANGQPISQFFWKMRAWVDCGLMALTFVLSLLVSVEIGIVVSIALSMVLCVKQAAITRIKILGRVPGEL